MEYISWVVFLPLQKPSEQARDGCGWGLRVGRFETEAGTVVLDPGPEDHPEHVDDIMRHTGGKIAYVLISHTHHDHVGALAALQEKCGAPSVGFKVSGLDSFDADIKLSDGQVLAGLTALHTPGHALDHLCFGLPAKNGDRVLFSADHVMSWSTSIVSPPGGDMKDYFDSLNLLLKRDDDVVLPGHGPALRDPRSLVGEMLAHRQIREQAIARKLQDGAATSYQLMDALYSQIDPRLRRAAERNVIAHLMKMEIEGKAILEGDLWRAA